MPDRDRSERAIGVACASLAAALFGLSAPAAKVLVALTDPWLLAGLLYVGAGASLGAVLLGRALLGAKGSARPRSPGRTGRGSPPRSSPGAESGRCCSPSAWPGRRRRRRPSS